MLDLLLKVIALGIASTMSPVIFGVMLSVLSGKYPKQRAIADLAGTVASVAAILAIGASLGSSPSFFSGQAAYFDILLGAVFLLFGLSPWLKHERKMSITEKSQSPKLGRWFVIGFVLNVTNFDAVILLLTGVKEVFQSDVLMPYKLALSSLSALFFILPTLLPLLVYLTMQERAERMLKPLGALMEKYGKYLAAAVFLVFGVYLLLRGIGIFLQ